MISIVIPTRNEELILENALKAVAGYSGDREIIVSDNGSSDRTVEIAKRYTDNVVLYHGDRKRTIAGVRNAGAKIATGEFLVFLDADITVKNADVFFERLLMLFHQDDKLVGVTVFIRFLPEVETFWDRVNMNCMNAAHLFYNNIVHWGGASGQFQMIRRDVFERLGGFNEKIVAAEDEEMFRRLAKTGKTYTDRTLTVYETGRRAHKIGWPRLLWQWNINAISTALFKKSVHDDWKEIR
ncbi:MAG: glycosyltransferase [Deltaproteobacteria bacterium]|nr:glycosyltransferase [Deltaproteobacteria bacterium]